MVIGISFDTPADNKLFAEAQEFGFSLLSDVDQHVGRLYEVRRDDDDQYTEFPRRISYLIDPAGVIRRVFAENYGAPHQSGWVAVRDG